MKRYENEENEMMDNENNQQEGMDEMMENEDGEEVNRYESMGWEELVSMAENGDTEAQYELGNRYFDGIGIEDQAKAVEWYQKAAEQGKAAAQKKLGDCYADGTGVEADMALGGMWYAKAYEQGYKEVGPAMWRMLLRSEQKILKEMEADESLDEDSSCDDDRLDWENPKRLDDERQELLQKAQNGDVSAQYEISKQYGETLKILHHRGFFPYNLEKSLYWLERSAEGGHIPAQLELGNIYNDPDEEFEMEADKDKALSWWRKAAEQGDAEAQKNLTGLCCDRGDVAEALYWGEPLAELGDKNVQLWLTEIYCQKGDLEAAFKWGKALAENGNLDIQRQLALLCYKNGDIQQGRKLGEQLVQAGYSRHHLSALGHALFYGENMEPNKEEGLRYLQAAADVEDEDAMFDLGTIYYTGDFLPEDKMKGIDYWENVIYSRTDRADDARVKLLGAEQELHLLPITQAEEGDAEAQFHLGTAYYYGAGLPINELAGIDWLRKAAKNGYRKAAELLGNFLCNGEIDEIPLQDAFYEGVYWLEKLAYEEADCRSFQMLGRAFYVQRDRPMLSCYQDNKKAEYWLKKAADLGSEWAAEMLDLIESDKEWYGED